MSFTELDIASGDSPPLPAAILPEAIKGHLYVIYRTTDGSRFCFHEGNLVSAFVSAFLHIIIIIFSAFNIVMGIPCNKLSELVTSIAHFLKETCSFSFSTINLLHSSYSPCTQAPFPLSSVHSGIVFSKLYVLRRRFH